MIWNGLLIWNGCISKSIWFVPDQKFWFRNIFGVLQYFQSNTDKYWRFEGPMIRIECFEMLPELLKTFTNGKAKLRRAYWNGKRIWKLFANIGRMRNRSEKCLSFNKILRITIENYPFNCFEHLLVHWISSEFILDPNQRVARGNSQKKWMTLG